MIWRINLVRQLQQQEQTGELFIQKRVSKTTTNNVKHDRSCWINEECFFCPSVCVSVCASLLKYLSPHLFSLSLALVFTLSFILYLLLHYSLPHLRTYTLLFNTAPWVCPLLYALFPSICLENCHWTLEMPQETKTDWGVCHLQMSLHSKKDFLNNIKHFYNGAKQESIKYKNATCPKCPFSSVSFYKAVLVYFNSRSAHFMRNCCPALYKSAGLWPLNGFSCGLSKSNRPGLVIIKHYPMTIKILSISNNIPNIMYSNNNFQE